MDFAVMDLIEVPVPLGGRAMVVSDLLLGPVATQPSLDACASLAEALTSWQGPGLLVIAGNLFDLLAAAPPRASDPGDDRVATAVGASLGAHPVLADAVARFAERPERRVVCIPGSRDRALAWDPAAGEAVRRRLCAEVALAVDMRIDTGGGQRVVRVEAGYRFDPRHQVGDPRNPAESPLGQHLLTDILPGLASGSWSMGMDRLVDCEALPRFLASRILYRRLARLALWLMLPILAVVVARFPLAYALARHPSRVLGVGRANRDLALVGITTAADVLLFVGMGALVARKAWAAVTGAGAGTRADSGPVGTSSCNGPARNEARSLLGDGYAGLIVGHTLRPELTHLGTGFFACAGAAAEVVEEHPSRLGMPPVFLHQRLVSWIEVEGGAEIHARLLMSRAALPSTRLIERIVARRRPAPDQHPAVVASFPHGGSWPAEPDFALAQRRVRRWAAAALAAAGVLDLLSAVTPPLRSRLELLHDVVPLTVSQTANALVALAGLGLVFLARGVRRGQRQAWAIAVLLTSGTALLHLVKGVDLEEAAVSLAIAAFLALNRRSFAASVDRPSLRRALATLVLGEAGAFLLSLGALEISLVVDNHAKALSLPRLIEAVGGRMIGLQLVKVPPLMDDFLTPALIAVTIGLTTAGLFLASRPVVSRRSPVKGSLARARQVVGRHGRGTLDYFALRADKHFFFHADTVVAYGVYGGVCLVSPDPVGPEPERDVAWEAFRRFTDLNGWSLAVLGAGEEWLPVYRASGMHDLYLGDEAVVDVTRLNLDGKRHKSLRQAVNRIAKYGYTISFHDPAHVDDELRASLEAVMCKSRRGDVERGFSMTLGRLFDPDDQGLLMAVARSPEGEPVAFCQYVPAPAVDGYSLDLMRRDDGEHPNGLIDFIVVETARHLQQLGLRGLGLNFAAMRAVLAGEAGDGLTQRVERWVLHRMSDSMQIESLWHFNAKFDPDWQARYFVYDSPEHLLPAAMAIARAESFWELPLVGRFLSPAAEAQPEETRTELPVP